MLIALTLANQDVNLNEDVVLNVTLITIALLPNGDLLKKPTLDVTPILDTSVPLLPHVKLMKIALVLTPPNNTLPVLKDKISVLNVLLMSTVPTDLERPVP